MINIKRFILWAAQTESFFKIVFRVLLYAIIALIFGAFITFILGNYIIAIILLAISVTIGGVTVPIVTRIEI